MKDSALWQLSACEMAGDIAAGRKSARDAVGASVDRMAARNGAMNAVGDDLSGQGKGGGGGGEHGYGWCLEL